MPGLRRYPDRRFVGIRSTMQVFDCEDPAQRAMLEEALGDAVASTFAPDTLAEARNRGFRPVQGSDLPPR